MRYIGVARQIEQVEPCTIAGFAVVDFVGGLRDIVELPQPRNFAPIGRGDHSHFRARRCQDLEGDIDDEKREDRDPDPFAVERRSLPISSLVHRKKNTGL